MSSMILVRGLPGSGKSTLAKTLIGFYMHVEADMFFMVDGEYKFDVNKIMLAHAWAQGRTCELLAAGFNVVVSNTFTTIKEMRPYFEIAKEFDCVPQVITCHAQYGNIHGVPEETLAKMKNRFVWDLMELYNGSLS